MYCTSAGRKRRGGRGVVSRLAIEVEVEVGRGGVSWHGQVRVDERLCHHHHHPGRNRLHVCMYIYMYVCMYICMYAII